ncbi:hypothetical protein [Streptomyces alboflavus]|uniref:hypothetical protein n=1 Tax=Streptomyces alboflavus TaxID=67267 RepID=UPI0004BF603F|nr:hypothetical protein [Streptomyces alboflavus]
MRGKARLGVATAAALVALTGAPAAAAVPTTDPGTSASATLSLPPSRTATPAPTVTPTSTTPEANPTDRMADTGAGVIPWIVAAAAGALGIGAVAFATTRRRPD